jgi:hypothetical protein
MITMADYKAIQGRIYYQDRLLVPTDHNELRIQIIYRVHSSGPGIYAGRYTTTGLVSRTYWWLRLSLDIQYPTSAHTYGSSMSERGTTGHRPPDSYTPLIVPLHTWSDMSVNHITLLPDYKQTDRRYKRIAIIVCGPTKRGHLITVTSLTTEELADQFVAQFYALNGARDTTISDRGTQFVSEFWRSCPYGCQSH